MILTDPESPMKRLLGGLNRGFSDPSYGGGLTEGEDFMSPTPKCDIFLESSCQELLLTVLIGLTWLNLINLGKIG